MTKKQSEWDVLHDWGMERGIAKPSRMARSFGVSCRTLRNWRKSGSVPSWVRLVMLYHELGEEFGVVPVEKMTPRKFEAWMARVELETQEEAGIVFGISRQSVNSWMLRRVFPPYVPLACAGYEAFHRKKSGFFGKVA